MTAFAYTPKHDDLIYDIGLHKGEDAEFYLRKGFRVVAFEADPDLITSCKERLKDFLNSGRLIIIEGAIASSSQDKTIFYKNLDNSAWGTVLSDWSNRNDRLNTSSITIEVQAIKLADAVREHGIPYFMKIDIEGVDTVCLDSLKEFEERPSYISIESNKTSFEKIKREIELLIQLGYTSFQAVEQSEIYLTSPKYPPREGQYVSCLFEEGSSGLFGNELEGKWKSRREILRQYRFIRLGYFLLGDDGIMIKWNFRGAGRLRSLAGYVLRHFTHAAVPGWYDTHARHAGFRSEAQRA